MLQRIAGTGGDNAWDGRGSNMRALLALVISALTCGSALAQSNTPTKPKEVMQYVRDAYKMAKTEGERALVTVWCKEKMASLSFHEQDRLTIEVLQLLQKDKFEEANALLDRDKAYDTASN
jgi:hypothetical protein